MAERSLLHKNKLDLLKCWLTSRGYEIQATKSIYEVLRANNGEDTIIIFKQSGTKEHLTVQDKDYKLIRQFIQETRKPKEPLKKCVTNYDRIRNMSVDELAQLLNRCDCDYPPYCKNPFGCGHLCLDCAKVWLESEIDTE